MNESQISRYTQTVSTHNDYYFRFDGFYKFHAEIDEFDALYFLANNKLFRSATSSDFVRVELLLWILDTRAQVWKKHIFAGHKSLAVRCFLCVRRRKIYAICSDVNRNEDGHFESFLVFFDRAADFKATVVKRLFHSHVDVEDDKLYFFDQTRKINVYHVVENRWSEIDLTRLTDLQSRLYVSDGKLFSQTKAYDLATGRCVAELPENTDGSELSYVCKIENGLCFSIKNNFDFLYVLHATEFEWKKVHLPAKKLLRYCRVCFSWTKSKMYLVYFDTENKSMLDAKLALLPSFVLSADYTPALKEITDKIATRRSLIGSLGEFAQCEADSRRVCAKRHRPSIGSLYATRDFNLPLYKASSNSLATLNVTGGSCFFLYVCARASLMSTRHWNAVRPSRKSSSDYQLRRVIVFGLRSYHVFYDRRFVVSDIRNYDPSSKAKFTLETYVPYKFKYLNKNTGKEKKIPISKETLKQKFEDKDYFTSTCSLPTRTVEAYLVPEAFSLGAMTVSAGATVQVEAGELWVFEKPFDFSETVAEKSLCVEWIDSWPCTPLRRGCAKKLRSGQQFFFASVRKTSFNIITEKTAPSAEKTALSDASPLSAAAAEKTALSAAAAAAAASATASAAVTSTAAMASDAAAMASDAAVGFTTAVVTSTVTTASDVASTSPFAADAAAATARSGEPNVRDVSTDSTLDSAMELLHFLEEQQRKFLEEQQLNFLEEQQRNFLEEQQRNEQFF